MTDVRPEAPLPDWAFPPTSGFRAEDLDGIPDLPPHTELIDGSLVFRRWQTAFHSLATDLLHSGLARCAPHGLRAARQMTVVLDRDNRPEPDLSIVRRQALSGTGEETFFAVADVVLVAEVISADTAARDRRRKPQLYAEAGIPHLWLVERAGSGRRPVVRTYELADAGAAYAPTGIHHDRLKLSAPFTIDIDLTEIDRM